MRDQGNRFGRDWLVCGIAIALGALFVRSSMFHIENSYAFLFTTYRYQLGGLDVGAVVAALLPFLQLTIGMLLLFFPTTWRSAFNWFAGLSATFAILQVIALMRDLDISCGCFSPSDDRPIGIQSIGISLGGGLAALAGRLLLREPVGKVGVVSSSATEAAPWLNTRAES